MKKLSFNTWVIIACAVISSPLIAQLDVPGYPACYAGSGGDLATTDPASITVTINTADPGQTIRGFGASDAWSVQFVGQWPLAKREAIADLLFEDGLDGSNNPRGVALSQWRFNIGAGSSRQNNIGDVWRRADTFYNTDWTAYDWTRLPGQRWFLQAAKARGVNDFIAFANSPPITMTKNGKAYPDSSSGTTNLAAGKADDYAVFLTDVVNHFRNVEGIDFTTLSPINEPQWDWEGGSQEGGRYSPSDIREVVDALATQNLGGTTLEVPESGEIKDMYSGPDYVDALYDLASPSYVGDEVDGIAGHSYWTDTPNTGLITERETLRTKLDEYPGLDYAMTEYSILGNYGSGWDVGIDPALYIARVAHFDMTIAEAVSWQWWLGVSPYNYKDGLVYIDYDEVDGTIYESKMLWAMGNYSRFVRPGMSRVATSRSDGATPADTATKQMVSAYYDSARNIVVAVVVNYSRKSATIALDVQGTAIDSIIPYVTSASGDLTAYAALSASDTIVIPKQSVVTLVGYQGSGASCGDLSCDPGEDACSCASDCGAPPSFENSCTDGLDNDCDSSVDCADSDCDSDPACPTTSCGNGVCDPGEDCNGCSSDCQGVTGGKPANRFCCGNGVLETPEGDGSICDGNV